MRGSIHIINSAADAERAGLNPADIVQAASLTVKKIDTVETDTIETDAIETEKITSVADSSATDGSQAKANSIKGKAKSLLTRLQKKQSTDDKAIETSEEAITPIYRQERQIDQGTLTRLGVKAL